MVLYSPLFQLHNLLKLSLATKCLKLPRWLKLSQFTVRHFFEKLKSLYTYIPELKSFSCKNNLPLLSKYWQFNTIYFFCKTQGEGYTFYWMFGSQSRKSWNPSGVWYSAPLASVWFAWQLCTWQDAQWTTMQLSSCPRRTQSKDSLISAWVPIAMPDFNSLWIQLISLKTHNQID